MSNSKLIIIRGYPGSGKTTVGKSLALRDVGVFVDHNAILTFMADVVGDDEGIYEEISNLELAMAKKLLADKKNTIVARGFSTKDSVDDYISIAKETQSDVLIFKLVASSQNLRLRVVAQERKTGFNPTTTEEALSSWITDNPLEPIPGEEVIDANRPTDYVVNQIISLLNSRPAD
jgi:shikimate kinase